VTETFSKWSPGFRRVSVGLGIAIMLFLYLPILTLVVYSFSESRSLTFPITAYTLGWYAKLAGNESLIRSIANSLIVAAGVVPLTLLLGVPAAYGFSRLPFQGSALVQRLLMMPLMLPGLITGLSILLVLKRLNFELSLAAVILGHTVAWLPIVIGQVFARLRRFDPALEEASVDLGAGPMQTFLRITLPNLKNAIIGSALLVFTLSFDEVAITFMLTGTENTLPMHIWAILRQGVTPELCAVATLLVAVSVTLVFTGVALSRSES
jgi:spermidine/putrescine transport system permease protein